MGAPACGRWVVRRHSHAVSLNLNPYRTTVKLVPLEVDMKLATLFLGFVVMSVGHAADSQLAGVRVAYESMQTASDTGRIECINCVVTIPQGSSPEVTASNLRRDLASGTTELSGAVRISLAGVTLLMDSATITSAADGAVVVRGSRIMF